MTAYLSLSIAYFGKKNMHTSQAIFKNRLYDSMLITTIAYFAKNKIKCLFL